MKTNLLRSSIVAALAATAAFAQNSTLLKATVPFAFIAGRQALPAGQYTVDRGPTAGTVMIRPVDGGRAAIVITQAVSSPVATHPGSLVFHRYGSTYFLSEVWSPGNAGHQLPPTRRERELARLAPPANTSIAAVH